MAGNSPCSPETVTVEATPERSPGTVTELSRLGENGAFVIVSAGSAPGFGTMCTG